MSKNKFDDFIFNRHAKKNNPQPCLDAIRNIVKNYRKFKY